jgi:hypothetical protein
MTNILKGMNMAKLVEDDDIRSKITIRKELQDLIPRLSDEEIQQLEENILKEGVRDPLILWQLDDQFVLVDGHNRFSICQKHNLQFPFKKIIFIDEEDAKAWMVKNQLGRRNLSKEQQSYLRGLRYIQEKQQGRRVDLTSAQNELKSEPEETAQRLASEYNVSSNTIKRDAQFAIGVDEIGKDNPQIKQEILSGKTKLKKKDIQSVGQSKKTAKDLFQVDQKKKTKVEKKITPESIAEIAFSFIRTEKKSIEEVLQELNLNVPFKSIDFFIQWRSSRGD